MKVFRVMRLEVIAARLILLGAVGLMVGLFAGSPSILSDLQAQRESDGVGVRQKKIYDAILVTALPDSDPGKAPRLKALRDASWSFYDIQAVRAPAPWQWTVTVLSGFLILIGQALNAVGMLRAKSLETGRRRIRRAE